MPSSRWIYVGVVVVLVAFVALNSEIMEDKVEHSIIEERHNKSAVEILPQESRKVDAGLQSSTSGTGSPTGEEQEPNVSTLNITSKEKEDPFPLPPEFHICRIEGLEYGGTKQPPSYFPFLPAQPRYQCAGQPYEDYMAKHQFPFVLKRHQQDPSAQWGKRQSILPKETTNQNIMIVGNSHTRQMAFTLLIMYQDQIQSYRKLSTEFVVEKYTLTGNNTLTLISNPFFIYSPVWQSILETVFLKHPLSELSAIVLGTFNVYNANYDTAVFWTDIREYGQRFPEQQINAARHDPFDLADLAGVYDGPIVWTSMMAKYKESTHKEAEQQIQVLQQYPKNRTNLQSIHARQHIEEMRGVECCVPSLATVGTCIEDVHDKQYSDGHRCMGRVGGPVDLVAWDVVEALWTVFEKKPATSAEEEEEERI